MKAFLITFITTQCIVLVFRMAFLLYADWPRERSDESMGENVCNILLTSGFVIWALYALSTLP